jgi:hypothetical protein
MYIYVCGGKHFQLTKPQQGDFAIAELTAIATDKVCSCSGQCLCAHLGDCWPVCELLDALPDPLVSQHIAAAILETCTHSAKVSAPLST